MNTESQIAIANATRYLIFIGAKIEYLRRNLETADVKRYDNEIMRLKESVSGFMEIYKRIDEWLEHQTAITRFADEIDEFKMTDHVHLTEGAKQGEVFAALGDFTNHCIYTQTFLRTLAVIRSYNPEASVRIFDDIFRDAVQLVAKAAYVACLLKMSICNTKEANNGK